MKPTRVKDCNVQAMVTKFGVDLIVTTKDGCTAIFTPPASPVVQRWAEEMRQKALQLELPLG